MHLAERKLLTYALLDPPFYSDRYYTLIQPAYYVCSISRPEAFAHIVDTQEFKRKYPTCLVIILNLNQTSVMGKEAESIIGQPRMPGLRGM